MASEWAKREAMEIISTNLDDPRRVPHTTAAIAEALDAARAQGRREGLEEAKQRSPIAWRYKVLVNKHSTGSPLPGEIFMLDINRIKVWGIPGAWRYSDGPDKPDVDWMCEAEPLFASQEPTA